MLRVHPLHTDIAKPARFTFPFCYEPHPLCVLAAKEVQAYIASVAEWREEIDRGKMFGVLVVEDEGSLGFLAAFSGLLAGGNDWPYFVPAVYNLLQPDGHFKGGEAEITAINTEVTALENSCERKVLQTEIMSVEAEADRALSAYKEEIRLKKEMLTGDERVRYSQFANADLRRKKKSFADRLAALRQSLQAIDNKIETLKRERRSKSDDLQRWLFSQYRMLNARGECRDLCDIFATGVGSIPPSGAGECCAPKLLQYAYLHGLHPVCMAEFWWGASPRAEVRHHLSYYPACRGKCLPILTFQLQGLDVDPDPRAADEEHELQIIYDDDSLCVVGKPSGMLSVPGKSSRRSVLSEMRRLYPQAEGPMIVHRLDMDTSGLMLVAKTTAVYLDLQRQFCSHTIHKKYVALLSRLPQCVLDGTINLPLRSDPLDRPRQVVDSEHGKETVTRYHIERHGEQIIADLWPETGRTHQLRVHCAHQDGLNAPIVGDPLYGTVESRPSSSIGSGRLMLHAEEITFRHPVSHEKMTFRLEAAFCNRLIYR